MMCEKEKIYEKILEESENIDVDENEIYDLSIEDAYYYAIESIKMEACEREYWDIHTIQQALDEKVIDKETYEQTKQLEIKYVPLPPEHEEYDDYFEDIEDLRKYFIEIIQRNVEHIEIEFNKTYEYLEKLFETETVLKESGDGFEYRIEKINILNRLFLIYEDPNTFEVIEEIY